MKDVIGKSTLIDSTSPLKVVFDRMISLRKSELQTYSIIFLLTLVKN